MTSLQQKDTTYTKIFVGGLPYHTTDDTLRRFFDPYGDIDEAVVITDRQTGKSRGYGFVTMSDRSAAERACKDPNPIIDGRKANVNLAYLGAKPRVPIGELIAAFPYGLKTALPSYFGSAEILGIPQVVYPSAYHLSTTPTATSFTLAATAPGGAQQAQLLPLTHGTTMLQTQGSGGGGGGGQFIDYATLAAFAAAASGSPSYPGTGSPLTAPGGCIPLSGEALHTMAAFPFAIPTGTTGTVPGPAGAFINGGSPTAFAALPYTATAPSPFASSQTLLGQLTAQPLIHPQHIHAKLQ